MFTAMAQSNVRMAAMNRQTVTVSCFGLKKLLRYFLRLQHCIPAKVFFSRCAQCLTSILACSRVMYITLCQKNLTVCEIVNAIYAELLPSPRQSTDADQSSRLSNL